MVGAQRRFDQVEIAADDGVVVDVRHVVQRVLDLRLEMLGGHLAVRAGLRVEARDEQRIEAARNIRIAVQRGGDEILALRNAGLLQIAAIGAQHAELARAAGRPSAPARCSRHCRPRRARRRETPPRTARRRRRGRSAGRSAFSSSMSCTKTGRTPSSPTSKVRSLMTRKPMFSRIGTRRDSATGLP